MVMSKLLFLFVSISLIAGCVIGTPGQHSVEPASTLSPLPTQPGDLPTSIIETPEMSTIEPATLDVFPLSTPEQQPPADDAPPRTLVGMTKADLARRLRVDPAWVEVVQVAAREPDTQVMSCLNNGAAPERTWENLDEVQWITLSVKGEVYYYVALVDLISYCDMPDTR